MSGSHAPSIGRHPAATPSRQEGSVAGLGDACLIDEDFMEEDDDEEDDLLDDMDSSILGLHPSWQVSVIHFPNFDTCH